MPMKILTGYTGTQNVTATDDRGLNRGIIGPGDYVLDAGNKFATTTISANTIRVQSGEVMIQGCHGRLPVGETQDVTIANGSAGLIRHDIIVARYTKNTETGIEAVTLAVVQGTAGATGVDPALTQNDIPTGGTTREVALKRVILTGLTITAVQTMYALQDTMATMQADIATAEGKIAANTFQNVTGQDAHGVLKLENGYMREWGWFAMNAMTYSGDTGGYIALTSLHNTFVGTINGGATGYYPNGNPDVCIHELTANTIKIGSNVNVAGGYAHWFVEGAWK